eukprot:scaffold22942_cov64-Phaeocystis_antarctica.AAC.2
MVHEGGGSRRHRRRAAHLHLRDCSRRPAGHSWGECEACHGRHGGAASDGVLLRARSVTRLPRRFVAVAAPRVAFISEPEHHLGGIGSDGQLSAVRVAPRVAPVQFDAIHENSRDFLVRTTQVVAQNLRFDIVRHPINDGGRPRLVGLRGFPFGVDHHHNWLSRERRGRRHVLKVKGRRLHIDGLRVLPARVVCSLARLRTALGPQGRPLCTLEAERARHGCDRSAIALLGASEAERKACGSHGELCDSRGADIDAERAQTGSRPLGAAPSVAGRSHRENASACRQFGRGDVVRATRDGVIEVVARERPRDLRGLRTCAHGDDFTAHLRFVVGARAAGSGVEAGA